MRYLTTKTSETKKLGESLAKKILRILPKKMAVIIGLKGDLGGGKTTFLQGFAKGLGIKQKILSPTFVIMKRFKIPHLKPNVQYHNLTHIDCYRVEKPEELLTLGFKDIISNPKNIVTIEWVERIKQILPKKIILVEFKFIDKNKRKISISRS